MKLTSCDGDELNILLILDDYMDERFSKLSPHLGVMSLRKPNAISSAPTMPMPVMGMLNNWLLEED